MKNIHVLPTENYKQDYTTQRGEVIKVVRLGQLILNKETNQLSVNKSTQWAASCDTDVLVPHHIYITSDEEIKEGDWVITPTNDILEWAKVFQPIGKKIILTTHQKLIKYGVQPIDDEFLKWFVENESCETVEIDRDEREVGNHLGGVVTEYGDYKIIIPEKEKLIIEIPKGYMNTGVSICNHFIADTNDSSNWDTIKFPLPQGKWSIRSVEGKIVTLVRTI